MALWCHGFYNFGPILLHFGNPYSILKRVIDMKYIRTELTNAVQVDGIYTVHYFEYTKDFAFPGELHNFWEIVYADKKRLFITAGAEELELEAGQMYIHRPGEFHNIRCDGTTAANAVVISFDCDCKALFPIAGQVITCGKEERQVMGRIIEEASFAFSTPLGDPYTEVLERAKDGTFGAEQLIRLYLEQLLILLIRGSHHSYLPLAGERDRLLADICAYLEKNVTRRLQFEEIRKTFGLSASVLKRIFREQMNCGVMEYFTRLKIDTAKQMIREEKYHFAEIAEQLGFASSQYFTTVFHRVANMTPSEYARSVKARFRQDHLLGSVYMQPSPPPDVAGVDRLAHLFE